VPTKKCVEGCRCKLHAKRPRSNDKKKAAPHIPVARACETVKQGPPCFTQGCSRLRLVNHVVCDEHHVVKTCQKCVRVSELGDRIDKRNATIAENKAARELLLNP
jgi:hypothetical protein